MNCLDNILIPIMPHHITFLLELSYLSILEWKEEMGTTTSRLPLTVFLEVAKLAQNVQISPYWVGRNGAFWEWNTVLHILNHRKHIYFIDLYFGLIYTIQLTHNNVICLSLSLHLDSCYAVSCGLFNKLQLSKLLLSIKCMHLAMWQYFTYFLA